MRKVRQVLHSMAQVDIEGQRSKEDQPSVGFPDICFAIEDFDVAFKGLVRAEHRAHHQALQYSQPKLWQHCLRCM